MYLARDCFVDQDNKNFERVETVGSEDLTRQPKSPVGLKDQEPDEAHSHAQQLVAGSIVAERYKVLSLIGRGAMGCVYKVEQLALRKNLALKTLNTIATSDVTIRRFKNEALAAGKLDHPNLVKAVDSGWIGTQPYLVMDLVEGQTLSNYLKQEGRLPLELALRLFIPICFGLAYAHEQGVVHRDLKPGNIMLVPEGKDKTQFFPKVVDFGIAKLDYGELGTLTKTGEVFGTPLYMSPEQCLGSKVDNRSDIYALGCVLYEALTGAPPFSGPSALETMMQHRNEQPLSLKEASLGSQFPKEVEQIVLKMLAKEPQDRYQNFLDVARDLAAVQRGDSVQVQAPSASTAPGSGRLLLYGLTATSATLLCVLLVFGFTIARSNMPNANPKPSTTTSSHETVTESLPATEEQANVQNQLHNNSLRPFSTIIGAYRVFEFGDRRVGILEIGTRSVPARNRVTVDKHHSITFHGFFMDICNDPQLLSRFREDDLRGLRLESPSGFTDELDGVPQRVSDNVLSCAWHLKYLETLVLAGIPITIRCLNSLHIEDLKRLTTLSIADTHIDGKDLAQLHTVLQQLTFLNISNLHGGRAVLHSLQDSKNIMTLHMAGCDLTNSDIPLLVTMPNLNALTLSRCDITDAGLVKLKNLKQVSNLQLADCPVTMAGIKTLASYANLRKLILPTSLRNEKAAIDAILPHCNTTFESKNDHPKTDWANEQIKLHDAHL
jgi:serine/threonine protein kinase